jgi:transcriptional regulator with XRE-family HTH domain
MLTSQPLRVPPLRALREAQGLGLREAARLAGVDPSHLLRAERGEGGISITSLWKLTQVLGPEQFARQLEPYIARAVREEVVPSP